ncbi:Crp/Fnr family transcriptional regulator [Sphingobacterium prati]|uniref:Crp/Fnr family transcriptional regulator n=1 Tax=Sphingobacterium prati TaxID=2737006 RepID=UPI001557F309|nr:Crp/Fnr family transcriptional regulator [Sphingobacterium prati]NPE45932.1 Crp/Fnr family transcriptional regulator [Sphingobacterium prati]
MTETEKYLADFKEAVVKVHPISDKAFNLLAKTVHIQEYKKNEVLLREGRVANDIFFVCKGALNSYFIDEKGAIWNKWIYLERDFASTRFSAIIKTPNEFTLRAIETTTVVCMPYHQTRAAINQNDELKNLYIAYLEKKWIVINEEREISLLTESATTRYLKLLQAHPGIDTRIPLQYIASHLSITPTQLSRIRKELTR